MSAITTHVLDTALGRPGAGVPVRLERPPQQPNGQAEVLAEAVTDEDGRVSEFGPHRLPEGSYRLVFDTRTYHEQTKQDGFFPEIVITFTLADSEQHYHVPLLLSPFTYSTYRGS